MMLPKDDIYQFIDRVESNQEVDWSQFKKFYFCAMAEVIHFGVLPEGKFAKFVKMKTSTNWRQVAMMYCDFVYDGIGATLKKGLSEPQIQAVKEASADVLRLVGEQFCWDFENKKIAQEFNISADECEMLRDEFFAMWQSNKI